MTASTRGSHTSTSPSPLERRASDEAGEMIALWALTFFVLLTIAGIFAFRQGWAVDRGNEMSVDRAVFTSINAITLTGFEQREGVERYKFYGQLVALGLTIAGTLITLIVGSLAVVRALGMRYSNAQVIRAALAWQIVALLAGSLPLAFGGDDWFRSVFRAASTFGNCGLTVGSIADATDWRIHLVLLPLAILGGFGLPVLMELFDRCRGRSPLSSHSQTVLTMSAGVYAIGAATLLALWCLMQDAPLSDFREAIASCSATAINARSAGFPLDTRLLISRPTMWIVVVLMMIGASPAGTGGGIKTTTIAAIYRNIDAALRGRSAGRAFGLAMVWLALYATIVFVAFICLLACEPQMQADRLFFLTVSAASNVGLSHDPISITGAGLYVLSATMLVGRLAPLMMLWWMAKTTDGVEIATA